MKNPFATAIPVTTCDSLPDARVVRYVGLARGNSVRAAPVPDDVFAKMKNMVGGELEEYTKIFAECREQCLDRLVEHARAMGANAILGMRFCSGEITSGAAELLAYGTAVVIELTAASETPAQTR